MTDRPANAFQTTHWTQVVAARGGTPEARQALRLLCETYYAPVELFVRRYRDECQDARDLTQEFFATLLEGQRLDNVDRTRGRFRSYLLGAVKHFLADRADREKAIKRGGEVQIHSLSAASLNVVDAATLDVEVVDPHGFPPDAYFDRQWAIAVVTRAVDTLRREAELTSETAKFEVLQRWLVTSSSHETAVAAARELKMSDGAFKVAVHRLRKRFRQVVIDQISETVDDPVEVQNELGYLITAMTAS